MLLLRQNKHMLLEQLTLNIHFFEVYVYNVYTYLCFYIINEYMPSYVHINSKDLTVKMIAPIGRN